MHGALHAFFHHSARRFVRVVNVAVEVIVIRAAAARANELCKAIFAFFTGEQARIFKQLSRVFARNAFVYAAHADFFVPCKLMAGIQIAIRRNRKIFVARPASGYAFGKERPAFEIDIEVEEVEPLSFGVTRKVCFA